MSKSTISIFELFRMFPDAESARLYFEARRWPSGAVCPDSAFCAGDEFTIRINCSESKS